MARRSALVNERGFTLAELLVVSAVLGIIMLGIFTVQQQGLSAYLMGAGRVEVQQNARAALDTMLNEVRSALAITAVPAGCGTGPVPTGGGGTSISITEQGGTAVQYQLVGTDLQRNGEALVGGVQTLRIWCYDATDTLTATATNVRTVHVQIRTQTESGSTMTSGRNQHAIMETRVRLRNF
jgi:prepilin-type N-terminal cleavage/methylation domain-containing protein